MASAFGNLNGSGPQQIWIKLERVGKVGTNQSQFYYELRYYGNGYGSWTGGTLYWSGTFAGLYREGSFTIPSSDAYDTYKVLTSGYRTLTHNSSGSLADQSANGTINGNVHSAIGSGSVSVSGVSSPDYADVPDQLGSSFQLSNPTTVGFTATWGTPDANGSPITRYELQYAENSAFTANDGITAVGADDNNVRVFSSRSPATKYWVRIRAVNGVGPAPWSTARTIETLGCCWVSDGQKWVPLDLRTSIPGTGWDEGQVPRISNGSGWFDPAIPVKAPAIVSVSGASADDPGDLFVQGNWLNDDSIIDHPTRSLICELSLTRDFEIPAAEKTLTPAQWEYTATFSFAGLIPGATYYARLRWDYSVFMYSTVASGAARLSPAGG